MFDLKYNDFYFLLRYCDREDFPCVMYDHECSGLSSGDATKVLFTNWVENAVTVTEKLTDGPLVLVGSSLGGWLALLTALNLKDRLLGLGKVRILNLRTDLII